MPKHIGIIMDGNGRWARERGLPRTEGHVQGAKVFKQIMDYGHDIGLEAMTFYAFSTENWKRPKDEIKALMQIFHEYLTEADETKYEREKRGFYLRVIGDVSGLPLTLQLLAKSACLAMNNKDAMVVNMALNYGGRQEIVHAGQQIAEKVKKGELERGRLHLHRLSALRRNKKQEETSGTFTLRGPGVFFCVILVKIINY